MREMKDSGIEWIGEIPSRWKILRFKNIAYLYTGNSIKDEEKNRYEDENEALPYISSKDINVLNNTANYRNGMYIKKRDNSFKKAKKGSTLMCIEGGSAGKKKTFLSEDVCFVNKLCCFDSSQDINNKYLFYFLNSPNYEEEFKLNLSGMIGGVSVSTLKNLKLCLPSLQEQSRIASFLDSKCSEIDLLHSDIEEEIETLKEYKKSVITEAVTKGLNPDAEMKDSGIEWIGKIPKGWSVKRIKNIGEYRNGLTYTPSDITDEAEGILVLRSSNIQNGEIVLNDNVYVKNLIKSELKVSKGDILICSRNGSRDLVGKNAIIEDNIEASFGAFMMIFRCNCSKYMYYILNSSIFTYYLGTFFTSTINQLTGSNFGNMKIVFCDDKKEQNEIVSYLDSKCSEIDSIIESKQQQLETLEQYKKSLIYEYVTGKKEVPANA